MKKLIICSLLMGLHIGAINASVDYSSLEGKSGAALKQAIKEITSPHVEISYGDKTWEAFGVSDVVMIEGREAWFDMYSNRLVYTSTGHSGMNIEHAVANSWWGGNRNAAYKDLHHLNPSDADANNRKNNNPLGIISGTPTWSNGLTNIGEPAPGIGGGAKSVFEPADEFKGDFARMYFYVFTVYADLNWEEAPACMYDLSEYPTLQPWAYEMLLDWARKDPVDSRENFRNMEVAKIQENENPYISIPGLAEYVWGTKKNVPFKLADAMMPIADRPAAPVFEGYDLAAVNTWSGRWWVPTEVYLSSESEDVDIYYSFDDTEGYKLYEGSIQIGQATTTGETMTIKAYSKSREGYELRSSVSQLTLTGIDSNIVDYKNSTWERIKSLNEINEDDLYVICSSQAYSIMGCEAHSTSSTAYIKAAGRIEPEGNQIIGLPDDSGIVQFVGDGAGLYYVLVNDMTMNPKGYLLSNESKKLSLAEDGRAVDISLRGDGIATLSFGSNIGTLQYNASSPRFCVYTSNQQSVYLYKYVGGASTGVGNSIGEVETGGERIFNLEGIEVTDASNLAPGIYVKINSKGNAKKVIIK